MGDNNMWYRKKRSADLVVALLAYAAIGFGVAGCDSQERGGKERRSSQRISTVKQSQATDNDGDDDAGNDDVNWGQPGSNGDIVIAVALLRRYYKDAAAGDGAAACALTARAVVAEIAQPAVNEAGGPSLPKLSCGAVMSKDLAQLHGALVAKSTKLRVTRVRVMGREAIAFLDFGEAAQRDIRLWHERGAWRIGTMLDTSLG